MSDIKLSSFLAAAANALSTELNSLASTQAALSSALDNSTDLAFWEDLMLTATFGVAPTANSVLTLYLVPSLDGTNYGDATSGASPVTSPATYVGVFPLRAVTTIQRVPLRGVQLPPGLYKYQLVNGSGQAFPASGSTLQYRRYRTQVV